MAWNGLEIIQPDALLGFCSYLFLFTLTKTSKENLIGKLNTLNLKTELLQATVDQGSVLPV